MCKPIWADLAMTPMINIVLIQLKSPSKLLNTVKLKESWKLNNPDNFQRETTPIRKPTSPTLLTIIALIAALLACILVYQKLINKYEVNPTPSQPINICTTLSAVTKTIIKKVNKDK